MRHFIFGYGSLIERESRLRTSEAADEVFPVHLSGYTRGWWARTGVPGLSTTFLGCLEAGKLGGDENGVNGVIYPVEEDHLGLVDHREQGYVRKRVRLDLVQDYTDALSPDDAVWVYVNDFENPADIEDNSPSATFPIVQSYVDICINGCLEIEDAFPEAKRRDFVGDFIRSTVGWNTWWVNDRIYPRRPFIYRPNAYEIDALLREHLPDPALLDAIYFE
jgi:cation transport regulator ChaC